MSRGAGILDRRVDWWQYTPTQQTDGSEKEAWTFTQRIWAQYNPDYGKSNERLQGSEFSGNTYATFLIRYNPNVSVRDQIHFQPRSDAPSRTFDIQSIDMAGERNEYLQLLGLERQTA